ncbi:MAG: hypothetical protein GKR98_08185 [Boseongicola sp.]|nr:MAG: hypothetical protein GKR98_08185 [Boseongicola sp.]
MSIQTIQNSSPVNVVGPYSEWPRKNKFSFRKKIALAGSASLAGIFVHCVVPMIA